MAVMASGIAFGLGTRVSHRASLGRSNDPVHEASLVPTVPTVEWSRAPILLALGAWRHLYKGVPLTYDRGYWAAVFPLGRSTACTPGLIEVFRLPFLGSITAAFVWVALVAWGLTFAEMVLSSRGRWEGRCGGRRAKSGREPAVGDEPRMLSTRRLH